MPKSDELDPPAGSGVTDRYDDALRALISRPAAEGRWDARHLRDHPLNWRLFFCSDVPFPEQGWKLHVSCATRDVVEMLDDVGAIVLAARSPFKLPATLQDVTSLNFGFGGETQLGKVMTIYSVDDDDFVTLARQLSEAWTSRRGPWVVTDHVVRADRRVFARWGAFVSRIRVDRSGFHHPVLSGPDGAEIRDERRLDGRLSPWASAPPLALDATTRPPALEADQITIGGRDYWPIHRYRVRPGTSVSLAVDAELRCVVIKRARRGALSDPDGYDAFDRLRNELGVLRALRDCGVAAAQPPGIVEDDETISVVQADLGAATVDQLPRDQQAASLPLLAEAAARLHHAGFVHRDLKASNAVRVGNRVVLIDFELGARIGRADCVRGGTMGYVVPDERPRHAVVSADAYALGATVFEVLSEMSPGSLPEAQCRGRMIGILARQGRGAAAELVARLTAPAPSQRATPADLCIHGPLADHWKAALASPRTPAAPRRRSRTDKWLRCAFEAGQHVSEYERAQEVGTAWQMIEEHGLWLGESLYNGAAGTVLVLRALGTQLGHGDFVMRAREGARWLASQPPQQDAQGLFIGNAGVAVALAAVAWVGDPALLEAARRRLDAAAGADFVDPDLVSGSAGIVLAGVMVSELIGQRWPIELVRRHADALVRRVDRDLGRGVPCWASSPSYNVSRQPYFGVAHGAAGIAVSLARFGAAAGCQSSSGVAQETLWELCAHGLSGPALLEGPARHAMPLKMWCHGTTGLLWALLQVSDVFPAADGLLDQLATPFLDAVTAPGAVGLCHGIAGVLEVVRGLVTRGHGGRRGVAEMQRFADLLLLLATRTDQGRSWRLPATNAASPTLMEGFLGPAAALALAARPARSPAILSRAWLAGAPW